MSIRVGLICEGSHDFLVLREIVGQIIREFGEVVERVDCIQPEMSATFQVGTGGWSQVKAWCERDGGQWYRRFLDKPIFATSPSYDLLVIHLDGDVVEHCTHPPLANMNLQGMAVQEIVDALKAAILNHWLSPDPSYVQRIVACVPVRHLEAWLASVVGPAVPNLEEVDMKDSFRGGPISAVKGDWVKRYSQAAQQTCKRLEEVRAACISFATFEAELREAAEAA
ncbi:hypothetical protein [Sphingomonas adhaesiva]|uniref:hypothetical protein n=1 Tax=Sphingomonas adhaesiva TaxID=28212 RepID=UPI002FF87A2E